MDGENGEEAPQKDYYTYIIHQPFLNQPLLDKMMDLGQGRGDDSRGAPTRCHLDPARLGRLVRWPLSVGSQARGITARSDRGKGV